MSKNDLALRPEEDENETLDDIAAEFEAEEAAQIEQAQQEEREERRAAGPSMLETFAAMAPGFLTNLYWKRLDIGQLSAEQGLLIHAESAKVLAAYNFPEMPAWLRALEKYIEPWMGLGLMIGMMTKQQIETVKAEKAKDMTPAQESEEVDD